MSGAADAFLRELVARGKAPGVQYAETNAGGAIRVHCAGWADLTRRRPMTGTTALMAYSMSKVLTAHAVWMLERAGRLDLDDPLARYVPDLPYGPAVTIRHLLEHRSGMANPIPLRWVHPAAEHNGFDEEAALDSVVRRYPKLRFVPGSRTQYSNLGYWLLGRVVERIAGRGFAAFMEEEVLRPAGIEAREIGYLGETQGYLERYSLLNLLRPLLTDRWIAGERVGRWMAIQSHYVNGPAFGGAIGTAAGFWRFGKYLLSTGDPRFVQQEGGGAGFRSLLRLDRRRGRVSVLMSNATGLDVSACLDRLDGMSG